MRARGALFTEEKEHEQSNNTASNIMAIEAGRGILFFRTPMMNPIRIQEFSNNQQKRYKYVNIALNKKNTVAGTGMEV